jgi:hypothetical protein
MIDHRIIELMNKELDAQTSAVQSARLYRHLEKNTEAQAYFDDLKKLNGILDSVDQVEPPDSLKMGILNAVRASIKPDRSRPSILSWVLSKTSGPAVPRYGFAVASGVCLGMLLFVVFVGDLDTGTNTEQLSGTIGASISPAGTVADYALFEGALIRSSVQVVKAGQRVFVEAEVVGQNPSDVALLFPAETFTVVGIRRQGGVVEGIRSEAGSISAQIAPSGRFIVELEQKGEIAPEIQFALQQRGNIVWEKTLRTAIGE